MIDNFALKARKQKTEAETLGVEDMFKKVNKKSRRGSRRQSVDPGQFLSPIIQYFFIKCMRYGNAFDISKLPFVLWVKWFSSLKSCTFLN